MKASAAFAIGLWTGAVVVIAVGALQMQPWQRQKSATSSELTAQSSVPADELASLRQENARLLAETQRLKETITELKSNQIAQARSAALRALRRAPFREVERGAAPVPPSVSPDWIEAAVASGDLDAIPRLEALAMDNDETALEALALLADRDGGEALTRVWNSTALRFPTRFTAARYLGATLEVNAQAELLIRKLFSDRTADMRLLYAAVEGIANPNFSVSLGREQAIAAPPHFRPNFAKRQQLLDALAAATVDEELQARIAQAREDLLARWSRAAAPGP